MILFYFSDNPKLLEDKLWQKDLGIKDYFKIEHCHTLRIGNYITKPPSSSDIFICLHGIRMTINNRGKLIHIDMTYYKLKYNLF